MKPSITVITLAVDDLERAFAFYGALGWPSAGIVGKEFENGAVAFFKLESGLRLALWPKKSLAADAGLPLPRGAPMLEVSLGHNVASKEEVDAAIAQARRAGATIVKEPQPTFYGGYAGYFQDPDGHLWEVVFNPSLDSLG